MDYNHILKTHKAFLFAPVAMGLLWQFEGIHNAFHILFIPAHKLKALLLKSAWLLYMTSEISYNTLELLITYRQVFIIFFNKKKTQKPFTPCLNFSILFFQLFLLIHVYVCFKV